MSIWPAGITADRLLRLLREHPALGDNAYRKPVCRDALKEELDNSTVAEFATVQKEGEREVSCQVESIYNALDVRELI